MKKVFLWFFLSCKRYLKKLPFMAVLVLLPVCAWLTSGIGGKEEDRIPVAVCALDEERESLGKRLETGLLEKSETDADGMFSFYRCESEEQVREEVASRRAECGYVIYEGLWEKLNEKKWKRSIGVYSAPSTVTAPLSTEIVFAEMIRLYDKELLEEYVRSGSAFESLGEAGSPEREEALQTAGELYEKWEGNGSTFHFLYEYLDGAGKEIKGGEEKDGRFEGFPARGLAAVFVFVTGLYGAVVLGEDEKRGLFLPLPYGLRLPCRLAALAAPAALSACSGLLSVSAGKCAEEFWKEGAAMAVYVMAVVVFSWLLKTVLKNQAALSCMIPFLAVGSLVFCPVFLDAGQMFPRFDLAGKWFLPYYYLRYFP